MIDVDDKALQREGGREVAIGGCTSVVCSPPHLESSVG